MANKIKNNTKDHLKVGDRTACGMQIDTYSFAYEMEKFSKSSCKCKKCEEALTKNK